MPRRIAWLGLAALASGCWLALMATAQDAPDGGFNRGSGEAAKCASIDGALLQRTKDGFKALKPGAPIPPDTMLVGFPEAELVSTSGKVGIKLLLYLGETLPVNEAAISLNDSPASNPDITIDRGVIALKNLSPKGDTMVRVRGGGQAWELTFKEPNSQVLVARFGRHLPGTKLSRGPKKALADEPLMHMGALVIKGSVVVSTGTQTYTMKAPPGPALITWDTGSGYEVKQLESLPEDVLKLKAADNKLFKEGCQITAKLAAGDLGKGMDELVGSDNPLKRKIAVAGMGAFDDLPRLWEALENTKHRDVREQAVSTLRNWIGRYPGQLTKLHDHLVMAKKYSAPQARTMIQLLRGFDEQDRKEPFIYQLLIDGLEQSTLPIRELAYWNLERLAPAGQKIAYDAAADEASRRQAVMQWRQLIPAGQLPPPPKKD